MWLVSSLLNNIKQGSKTRGPRVIISHPYVCSRIGFDLNWMLNISGLVPVYVNNNCRVAMIRKSIVTTYLVISIFTCDFVID